MKLAAALIISFAVVAISFAEDHPAMKEVKLPQEMRDELARTGEPMDHQQPQAQRRGGGGKGGKGGESQPQGWGWGGPPAQGWGWGGPPAHGGWGASPIVIPIPMMGWGGGYRSGGY